MQKLLRRHQATSPNDIRSLQVVFLSKMWRHGHIRNLCEVRTLSRDRTRVSLPFRIWSAETLRFTVRRPAAKTLSAGDTAGMSQEVCNNFPSFKKHVYIWLYLHVCIWRIWLMNKAIPATDIHMFIHHILTFCASGQRATLAAPSCTPWRHEMICRSPEKHAAVWRCRVRNLEQSQHSWNMLDTISSRYLFDLFFRYHLRYLWI